MGKEVTIFDLIVEPCVVDTDTALTNRFSAALGEVESTAEKVKKIVGIMARTANTGYFKFVRGGTVILTVDMAVINALTEFVPLDIACPAGEGVTVYAFSTTGTAIAQVQLLIDETT